MPDQSPSRFAYSFVVDAGAGFAYQAWHLAHSLVEQCGAARDAINIHFTPEVRAATRNVFAGEGFRTHDVQRFGDGKYCNKIAQLRHLHDVDADVFVLLDTDTIAVSDLRAFLDPHHVSAKIVDEPNPPLHVLEQLAELAGLGRGIVCYTDSGRGRTLIGNCNGGMYSIPANYLKDVGEAWRDCAEWLLKNPELLSRSGSVSHIDQVAFWMALASSRVPFRCVPSNANYFVHFAAPHLYEDTTRELALLHYHDVTLNVLGRIEPSTPPLSKAATEAIRRANEQISKRFHNELFWDLRYARFPERGSGVGSRGENLQYKRALLRSEGLESATSVLDIGCGDLEVLSGLKLNRYTGVDLSSEALTRARLINPHGDFRLGISEDLPEADFVLCLEVLIHQPTRAAYFRLIDFIALRTRRTLVISGYEQGTDAIENNPMVFFHEPLEASLRRTERFSSVRRIGAHTDVAIYRCDV